MTELTISQNFILFWWAFACFEWSDVPENCINYETGCHSKWWKYFVL